MKLTENIDLREIVPYRIWQEEKGRAIRKMNGNLILGVQAVFDFYNEVADSYGDCTPRWEGIIMNTLWKGGNRDESGLRVEGHQYYRDGTGMHDNGNAIDFVPFAKGYSAKELVKMFHEIAVQCPEILFGYGIWRIESILLADTWIHMDAMFSAEQMESQQIVFIDKTNRYSVDEYRGILEGFKTEDNG